MTQEKQTNSSSQENSESTGQTQTPLDAVREQQAKMHNRQVEDHADPETEIPGHSIPSDRRRHPQRQTNYSAD